MSFRISFGIRTRLPAGILHAGPAFRPLLPTFRTLTDRPVAEGQTRFAGPRWTIGAAARWTTTAFWARATITTERRAGRTVAGITTRRSKRALTARTARATISTTITTTGCLTAALVDAGAETTATQRRGAQRLHNLRGVVRAELDDRVGLEQLDLSDPVGRDAGFVGDGTDDVADAHAITLTGGQKHALLPIHCGRIWPLASGERRAHRTGDGRLGACRHELAPGAFVQSQRSGGKFERVMRFQERREQRHLAGRRAAGIREGGAQRGAQGLHATLGVRLAGRRRG